MLDQKRIQRGFELAKSAGVIQRTVEDRQLTGRTIRLDGQDLLNFASCGYLGLEFDPALRDGVIDAVTRYGTQFSSSRVYLSAPLYAQAEALLEQITGRPTLLMPSTSLGHQSVFPVLIGRDDAVLMDQYVHNSVQSAVQMLRRSRRPIGVSHNDAASLETKIAKACESTKKVWYLIDGLYSMFGTIAPFEALDHLLQTYPQLHIYCDDAHGTGWMGTRGQGFALSHWEAHPRVIAALSLNKSFGCAGGAIAFADGTTRDLVRDQGGPINFSGPVQPPMLGAIVASARLHLGAGLAQRQEGLRAKITCFDQAAAIHGLEIIQSGPAPIRYLRLGSTAQAVAAVAALKDRGFFLNCASYPAVAERDAGLRLTLTNHLRLADIEALVSAVAEIAKQPAPLPLAGE